MSEAMKEQILWDLVLAYFEQGKEASFVYFSLFLYNEL